MFDFKIIMCPNGMEIIDRRQKTYYHQLTSIQMIQMIQMIQYIDMEIQLAILDKLERNARLECRRLLEI